MNRPKPKSLRIDAQWMFTGNGEPIEDGSITAVDGLVEQVGPSSRVSTPDSANTFEVPFLLPGLWDSHIHFWGSVEGNSAARAFPDPVLAGARSAQDAELLLNEGITSVRSVGGVGIEIGRAIAEGTVVGPTVHAAGAMLSIPGGHGDPRTPGSWPSVNNSLTRRLCSGVDDCVLAVREQIRRGAEVIKICVSGGVMSDAEVEEQQFSNEEIEAMVHEAARARRGVAAHAHGSTGILAAVKAGVTSIEHGSRLTEEAAAEMARKGIILVPTRAILEAASSRSDLSDSARRKAVELSEDNRDSVQIALANGVPIASGSDLGISNSAGSHSYAHARAEIAALVRAGLNPLQALIAATSNGPKTLGPRAPKSGVLEPGHPADAVSVNFDPLSEPEAWGERDRVTHVWKGARVLKSPS